MTMALNGDQRAYLRAHPVAEDTPTNIRLALRLVDRTLQDLAAATGIHTAQLSRYLAGRDLRLSTAQRIASAFGVGVDELWPRPLAGLRRRRVPGRRGGIQTRRRVVA